MQVAKFTIKGMAFPVKVLERKEHFGRVDYHIEPDGGEGQAWVSENKITDLREDKRKRERRK